MCPLGRRTSLRISRSARASGLVEVLARFWQGFESPIITTSFVARGTDYFFIFCHTHLKRWRDILDSVLSTLLQREIAPRLGVSPAPQFEEFERSGTTWRYSAGEGVVNSRRGLPSRLRTYQHLFLLVGAGTPLRDGKPLRPTFWLAPVSRSACTSVGLTGRHELSHASNKRNVEESTGSGCDRGFAGACGVLTMGREGGEGCGEIEGGGTVHVWGAHKSQQ